MSIALLEEYSDVALFIIMLLFFTEDRGVSCFS